MQKGVKSSCFRIGGIVLAFGGIADLTFLISRFSLPLKNRLILALGIKKYAKMPVIATVILAVGLVMIAAAIIPVAKVWCKERRIVKEKRDQAKQRSKIIKAYAVDSENPVLAKERLIQLDIEKPQFRGIIAVCLNQLEEMDRIQAKQNFLIKTNGAGYLKDTMEVLDKLERKMCRMVLSIVNSCETYDAIPDEQKEHDVLNRNAEMLSIAQKLLDTSLESINNRIKNVRDDSQETASDLIEILRSYSEEG